LSLIDNDYLALGHSGVCLQRMHQILSHSKRLRFTHEVNSRIQQRTTAPSRIMNNLVSLMERQCLLWGSQPNSNILFKRICRFKIWTEKQQ